jgi:hypothetical protein
MAYKFKKAIENIKHHLIELDNVKNVLQGNTWKASLKDSINLYIGFQSSISKRLDELYFTKVVPRVTQGDRVLETMNIYDDSQKENFKDLIYTAIKHIESNGIYKNESSKNILGGFSSAQIIGGIVLGITIIFNIGNYLGKREMDRQIIEYEGKIKESEMKYQDSFKEVEALKKQLNELIPIEQRKEN